MRVLVEGSTSLVILLFPRSVFLFAESNIRGLFCHRLAAYEDLAHSFAHNDASGMLELFVGCGCLCACLSTSGWIFIALCLHARLLVPSLGPLKVQGAVHSGLQMKTLFAFQIRSSANVFGWYFQKVK